MGFKKLQIKQLSKTGELLRCLNCHASQVTVFRAFSSAALTPFQRALAGVPGPERFTIVLDGSPFEPDQHSLIGFGELFPAAGTTTLQFLTNMGISESSANSLLVSYGLDNVVSSYCTDLSEDQERRLRILAATSLEDKILILNNPFEIMNSQWKERFAELVISFARNKNQIVIIPSLSYRPQHWINNEMIARIQVGENIQKTIGFSSGSSEVAEMIKMVREDFNLQDIPGGQSSTQEVPLQTKTSTVGLSEAITPTVGLSEAITPGNGLTQETPDIFPSSGYAGSNHLDHGFPLKRFTVILTLVAVITVSLYGWMKGESTETLAKKSPGVNTVSPVNDLEPLKPKADSKAVHSKKVKPELDKKIVHNALNDGKKPLTNSAKPIIKASTNPSRHARAKYALDLYPQKIRQAVLATFDDSNTVRSKPPSSRNKRKSIPIKKGDNLFSLLESISGTGEGIPDRKNQIA